MNSYYAKAAKAKNRVFCILFLSSMFFTGLSEVIARPADSLLPPTTTPLGSQTLDIRSWIDANWLLMIVTNKGSIAYDQGAFLGKNDGLYYPSFGADNIKSRGARGFRGHSESVIFAGGIWIAAIDSATGDTIATVSEYSDEFSPGQLGTSALDAANDPALRVYKLYRDSLASNPNQDYLDWPVAQGAPVDNLGRPEIHGKQTLWAVFNDGEPSMHNNNATGPFGLDVEIQLTVWAFDEPNGTDSLPVPRKIGSTHIAGPSQGSVGIEVVDHAVLTGHDYQVVFGVDSVLGDVWHLIDITLGDTVLFNQTSASGIVVDGMKVVVINGRAGKSHLYQSASPLNVSPHARPGYTGGSRWYTAGTGASGGELLFGGIFMEPNFWGATTLGPTAYDTVEIRWRPIASFTDLTGDGLYTPGEPYVVDDPTKTQKAFMYQTFSGGTYEGFFDVPFTAWDVSDPVNPRQLNVVVRDRDQDNAWNCSDNLRNPLLPNGGDQRFNYTWILGTDYDPTGTMYGNGSGVGPNGGLDFFSNNGSVLRDAMWMLWLGERGNTRGQLAEECITTLTPGSGNSPADTFAFTAPMAGPPPLVGDEANALYLRYKIINTGTKKWNNMLVGLWFDPDLGNASDDLVGSDPLDDLFFCYNGQPTDANYGSRPPVFGAKLLEGPVVASINDSGWINGTNVNGLTNRPLHAYIDYRGSTDPNSTQQTYHYLDGLELSGAVYIDPTTGSSTKFQWNGDPVTGTGWVDFNPGDRRSLGSTGPFNLAPGDTQYVVWKLAVGQGDNNLHSITKAREILNKPIDSDNDGVAYYLDNCPNTFNPSQADSDGDGIGDACATPTDVDDDSDKPLPGSFALHQNYPNPFNPSTIISFDLPVRSKWQVTIFNMMGQVVRRFNGESSAGTVTFEWDASDFATGLYLYRAEAGEFSQSRKMLLLK